jgi:hypothetical protein
VCFIYHAVLWRQGQLSCSPGACPVRAMWIRSYLSCCNYVVLVVGPKSVLIAHYTFLNLSTGHQELASFMLLLMALYIRVWSRVLCIVQGKGLVCEKETDTETTGGETRSSVEATRSTATG